MARKNRDELPESDREPEPVLCPLCERVIPDDQKDDHHLVPKSKGGKQTVCLHRVCHNQIHAIFTDSQLAKKFSTIEAILEDPAVQKFVAWVKTKPPGFSDLAREARPAHGAGRGRK
jgi:5-methylcytosine-specific restriction endonuclease McrA